MFAVSFLLTGCFGGNSTPAPTDQSTGTTTTYQTTDFSINVPTDWDTIESKDFTSNIPKGTIVAFRNNIKSEVFTANLNISVTDLQEVITSQDFETSSKANIKSSLLGYTETSTAPQDVKSGTATLQGVMFEFQGKKSASDPILTFKQLYVVRDKTGYTLTAAYLPDEDASVVNSLTEMLNSFMLK